ncbi:MAG: magnesium-protoporphyrin IX monomethyl ester cyclase [Crocinitomicaceae bacterium]|nr:magnesium-protoporphyrin IX monomethyl ester cyclase [Crocinitomicaceae bacterium]|tara:strand:+ start:11903 stop:13378 length:1476 start_codon:yes stop_codon:yes gene_type:complete
MHVLKSNFKILLINPPHKSIGSRIPNEHLPPLGLLSIAGPLIDAGFQPELLDADYSNMKVNKILNNVNQIQPDIVLMGHSGSTSAQPIINELAQEIKGINSTIKVIIGGVFPTYHWKQILVENEHIDYVVCGEGEETTLQLIQALNKSERIENVMGIAYRAKTETIKSKARPLIEKLDNYRIAWELMEGYHYTYWGKKKAVVLQFSRGCPYPCNYCGQSLFWKKWRNRNPQLLADEIEMLHHDYGIEVINFADENPSTNKHEWKLFLEALIRKNLNMILVGSIRADNIVRDEKHLHLYKQAGFERFLLGIENYDEVVLEKIKKAGSAVKDKKAIELLRKYDILSMATYVVGFGEEKLIDFYNSFRQLLAYDPDQVQLLYVTPHQWTPYFKEVESKNIILDDQSLWDYKHQVLETPYVKPWKVILLVKLMEVLMQIRPKAIGRWLFHRDRRLRKAMFWYNNIGKRVWFFELYQFFFVNKRLTNPKSIKEMWS